MAGLRIEQVTKSFGSNKILDNVSLELAEGELLVILGPSGCGKSTLLRLIAGLEELDAGEIFIGDRQVDKLRPRDRNVALVFQNYSLYPHMTVAKNLAFPLTVAKVPKTEIKEKVAKVAAMLGLENRLQAKPSQLSGGQRQRVALGRAIIREPSLFLLDEPLSNLDADLRARMRLEIVALQKQLKKAMIHVTHDQTEALTMADRIALLDQGNLIQLGTPEELYRQPATTFVASFIGQPKINLVEIEVINGYSRPFNLNVGNQISGKATLGIRPEAIEVWADEEYSGQVESAEYLGDQYFARIRHENLLLTASKIASEPQVGRNVTFSLKREDLLFFDADTGKRLDVAVALNE
ncbi:MAG: ABC transporter ATP-binding protein [bacterium]|nr:ABC transporter ATP-binding protein [bacterium]